MTVDRSWKIGLRQFTEAVFEICQHQIGRRTSQVEMNRVAEFSRHGRCSGQILSHAGWQEAFVLERVEDVYLVALALFPGLTVRRVIVKGTQSGPYL